MNLPSSADSSLYQLTQEFSPPPNSLTVSNTTFRGITKALINFLIDRQLPTTVWFKFPWLDELERYYQQGQATQIYFCTTRKEKLEAFSSTIESSTEITSLLLESSSQLKREFYIIVLSAQFCCLLLARRQPEPTLNSLQENGEQNTWQFIYSFEPKLIERILTAIKYSITVTDTTPEDILTTSRIPVPLPTTLSSEFINSLLMQQIQQTEIMQKDEDLINQSNQKINKLVDSLQFKSEVLKNLTQEISLPLTNMKTALLLLNSRQSKKEHRQRYLDLLQRECEKQTSIVAGLLELVAFDQSTGELGTIPKLEELIPGLVSTYQPLAEEKGITLGYTVPPEFPAVFCPEAWLRQILQNILSNSLKYTPAGGRIAVKAFLKPNRVELTIADTGLGIEPTEIPKIFDSFYRGRVNNEPNSGAGLGLTIVKYLLARCGGEISVTSKLAHGTTFTITLPTVNSELEED